MRNTAALFVVSSILVSAASWIGCSSTTCVDDNNCDSPTNPDGSSGSSGGEGGMTDGPQIDAPADCDLKKEPKDSAPCIDDGVGVFVDARGGDDSGPGSKAKPFKTIGNAIEKAGQKRIYVCEGDYPEKVKLTAAAAIYGGFACEAWTYNGKKPNVSPQTGYPLEIADTTGSVEIVDVRFAARPGTASSPNSVALFVHSASNVTLRRAELEAAAGANGTNGDSGISGTADKPLIGESGTGATPGLGKTCTCTGSKTTTGAGGGAGGGGGGGVGAPAHGGVSPVDGAGGMGGVGCTDAEPNGSGNNGANAGAGSNAPKGSSRGTLTASGWTPQAGADGDTAEAGQGGGGGGGQTGGGGGGGCGGCGGTGGKGGNAGGASVAALALDSPIKLIQSTLMSAKAGNGGMGGGGGQGVAGGSGANGGNPDGCSGGKGGSGGNGGTGSGGAGGISAAVLYKGAKPTAEGSMLKPGAKGDPGQGGTQGTNDGMDGDSAETLEVQ